MLHFRRYLAALLVLSALYGTYALAVAPWVEPPPAKRREASAPTVPLQASSDVQDELARLFPPDDWRRNNPKILETDRCTLLIQDYQPTPDGRLELHPCTLIFHTAAQTPADGDSQAIAGGGFTATRRPIVLDAPQGAVLEFDQQLDLARAQFGRLQKGTLEGPITIFSPPTRADGRDALLMTTRHVRLDRDRVFTPHEVEFRYGDSFGSGRDLTINLVHRDEAAAGTSKSRSGGVVQSLTLARIDRLHVATERHGLFGDSTDPNRKSVASPTAPLDVTCQGPFTFDVTKQLAVFDDQVEVVRVTPGAAPDRLTCDRLLLEFLLRRDDTKEVNAGPPASGPAATAGMVAAGATKPGGLAADDPLAGRLQWIIAIGSPAMLVAPSSGLEASAARMEYSLAKRRITLQPDDQTKPVRRVTQVSLRQHEQHFTARQLQYELAEPGHRLGRLWAEGQGELRMLQGSEAAGQTVIARWEKELNVRPQERNQVISLLGAASVIADPLGRFDADELHLWVLEVPVQPADNLNSPHAPREEGVSRSHSSPHAPREENGSRSQTPPVTGLEIQPTARDSADDKEPRITIVPDRLLAIGNVRLTSPQLEADTSELQAWFINLPPGAPQSPAGPPPDSPGLVREPIQPAGFAPPAPPQVGMQSVIRPPNLQKFHVAGEKIQIQLFVQGRKFDLQDLTIRGRALIDETRTSEPGQEPIHIAGNLVELRQGTTPQATMEVSGQPAEAGGRGLMLSGAMIHVHRGENRMWINGPGEATLPAPGGESLALVPPGAAAVQSVREPQRGPAAPPPGPPQKLHLVWQQGLTFDGRIAKFDGDVQARTATQLALSQTLEATLSERIDFAAPQGGQRSDVARLHLDGGVFIENHSVDERGQKISHEQMQVPNLTIDRAAGTLHSEGRGWVSTVRRSGAGLPGAPAAAASPPAAGQAGPAAADDQPLTSVHIAFQRGIDGNLAKREVQFHDQVRTTYSPAREFTDRIVAKRPEELSDRAVLMTSEKLTLTDVLRPDQRWMEMQATGNVRVEGRAFFTTSARVGYDSAKEKLVIEGDGYADANLWYEAASGAPPSQAVARKFTYLVREGVFESEGSRSSTIWPNGRMRLPQSRPQSPRSKVQGSKL